MSDRELSEEYSESEEVSEEEEEEEDFDEGDEDDSEVDSDEYSEEVSDSETELDRRIRNAKRPAFKAPTAVGQPSSDLPLPIEIFNHVVDYLAERDMLSIARLALSSRAFYLLICDDLAWEKRARALGATEMMSETSWAFTWRQQYGKVCRDCRSTANLLQWPYLESEPIFVKLCQRCSKNHPIISAPKAAAYTLLSREEIRRLVHSRCDMEWWISAEVEQALTEKRARRSGEIGKLLDLYDSPDKRKLISTGIGKLAIKAETYPSCHLRRAAEIICATRAPTKAKLDEVLELANKRDAVEGRIIAFVAAKPDLRAKLKDQKIKDGLDWLCGESKANGNTETRTGMSKWRDEIARGKQTIERFVKEVQNPTISHSAADCSCGRTPALACPESSCGRCCSGCARHPREERSYGGGFRGYGYRGRRDYDYDEYDDYDDDEDYRSWRY